MNKKALLERLVRLAATDVPNTPRLLMRHRSPEELAALQQGVEGAFRKFELPAKAKAQAVLEKVPHAGVRKALQSGADMMIENPEMIPMQAVPVPGVSLGYLAAKKGLERGLDRLAPMPKLAFSTNAFSGPMNPVIETGASFQGRAPINSLAAPVTKKAAATKPEAAKGPFKLEGHTTFQGLGIAIENQKGSVRSGTDKDGKPWRTVMKLPYGYIKGSKGADGEEVDAYVGPKKDATHAFVVHQKKENGKYDEDKVMLGQPSEEAARKAYLAHYNTDRFLGPIKAVPMERLKELVESGKKLVKISSQAPDVLGALNRAYDRYYTEAGKKTAASSPTRGGFMLASDIPAFKAPSLAAPVEKKSEFLASVPGDEGQSFKRSKYAASLERERKKTVRIFNGDHYQYLLDQERGDGIDRGELPTDNGTPYTKQADVSPTSPLGDGGGNPHRYQSWQNAAPINSLRAPLIKKADDYGGTDGFYYGSWQGGGGRGPVNEAGFRQASDQNGAPVNSLRRPVIRKEASLVPGSPTAAKHVGTKPMMGGAPGLSIADQVKPKGMKFGGPLPGANKTTIGGYQPPSLK